MMKRVLLGALLLSSSAVFAIAPPRQKLIKAWNKLASAWDYRESQDSAAFAAEPGYATASSLPADTRLLDGYPGATYALSLRRLRSGYSGPALQVQRATDGRIQDIGFTPSGDLDEAAARAFCGATPCGVAVVYNQSESGCGDAAQPVPARQFHLILSGAGNKPVLRGGSSSGMRVPDCAAYKTPTIDAFIVTRIGSLNTGPGFRGGTIIGYPRTPTSDVMDFAWGISAASDALQFQVYVSNAGYNNNTANPEGLTAAYRNQLFQYEFSSARQDIRWNTKVFMPANPAVTISYPNPVGLVIGFDATEKNALQRGDLAEIVLYGEPQPHRDAISVAQSRYWGIVEPPSVVRTPDGFTWAPIYRNSWQTKFAINGRSYFTESPGDLWSMWRATNATGPLWRFEVRQGDADNVTGNERSELDGAASPSFPVDATVQMSYAVLLEPGQPIHSSWNVLGQYHYNKADYPPASFGLSLQDDRWAIALDGAAQPVTVWTAPDRITRDTWYDFFIEQRISSTGDADVLMVWINGTQVLNRSGRLFPHGRQPGYWKIGIYRGDVVPQTEAARFANLEVVNKAVTPIDSRIASPLPHPVPKS